MLRRIATEYPPIQSWSSDSRTEEQGDRAVGLPIGSTRVQLADHNLRASEDGQIPGTLQTPLNVPVAVVSATSLCSVSDLFHPARLSDGNSDGRDKDKCVSAVGERPAISGSDPWLVSRASSPEPTLVEERIASGHGRRVSPT